MTATLNELYYELGLATIELGNRCGWDVDKPIDVHFTAKIASDGRPCIVMEFEVIPFGLGEFTCVIREIYICYIERRIIMFEKNQRICIKC